MCRVLFAVVRGAAPQVPCEGLASPRHLLSRSAGSTLGAQGLSCSSAHGIFLDRGPNLCLLHCWVDSVTRSRQGSPGSSFLDETPLTIKGFSVQPEATYVSAKAQRRGRGEDRCLSLGPF